MTMTLNEAMNITAQDCHHLIISNGKTLYQRYSECGDRILIGYFSVMEAKRAVSNFRDNGWMASLSGINKRMVYLNLL